MASADDDPLIDAQPSWSGASENQMMSSSNEATEDCGQLRTIGGMPKKQIFCRNYEQKHDTVLVNVPVPKPNSAIGETNVFTHSYHAARSNCFLAWLSFVCFVPIGVVSVLFSCLSSIANKKRDFPTAQAHGKTAHKLALAGVIAGAVFYTVLVVLATVNAVNNSKNVNVTDALATEFAGFGM